MALRPNVPPVLPPCMHMFIYMYTYVYLRMHGPPSAKCTECVTCNNAFIHIHMYACVHLRMYAPQASNEPMYRLHPRLFVCPLRVGTQLAHTVGRQAWEPVCVCTRTYVCMYRYVCLYRSVYVNKYTHQMHVCTCASWTDTFIVYTNASTCTRDIWSVHKNSKNLSWAHYVLRFPQWLTLALL